MNKRASNVTRRAAIAAFANALLVASCDLNAGQQPTSQMIEQASPRRLTEGVLWFHQRDRIIKYDTNHQQVWPQRPGLSDGDDVFQLDFDEDFGDGYTWRAYEVYIRPLSNPNFFLYSSMFSDVGVTLSSSPCEWVILNNFTYPDPGQPRWCYRQFFAIGQWRDHVLSYRLMGVSASSDGEWLAMQREGARDPVQYSNQCSCLAPGETPPLENICSSQRRVLDSSSEQRVCAGRRLLRRRRGS